MIWTYERGKGRVVASTLGHYDLQLVIQSRIGANLLNHLFDYLRVVPEVFAPDQQPIPPIGRDDVGVYATQMQGGYGLIDFPPARTIMAEPR